MSGPATASDPHDGDDRDTAWGVILSFALDVRAWPDGNVVVYHAGSGETHLLNEVAGFVLAVLRERPRTVAELGETVAARFDLDPDGLAPEIARLVARFDELGLVEPRDGQ